MPSITIDQRFCGPPTSGNGGYSCGMLAEQVDAEVVEVTLRKPIPLNAPMRLAAEGDKLAMYLEDELIAVAKASELELEVPAPPSLEAATEAAKEYIGHKERQPFPTCFVCGPDRHKGDGLRIFAGPVAGSELFASPWTPNEDLADEQGNIRDEFLWAALDCPGAYAVMGNTMKTVVLGRLTAKILHPVKAGDDCIIIAWPLEHEGRKHFCGTALYDGEHRLCALAKAVWIELVES